MKPNEREYVKKCNRVCHKCEYHCEEQQGDFLVSYCKLQAPNRTKGVDKTPNLWYNIDTKEERN